MEYFKTQIKLIFSIAGDHFSIDEFTNLIKVSPTQFWKKGDIIPLQKGFYRKDNKVLVRNWTSWEFSTGFIQTLDFEDVSKRFEEIFEKKTATIRNYIQGKEIEAMINIIVEIADEAVPGIHFNKQIIKMSEELGAEIDIDMYLLTND